jgi:hypothetical protein
MVMMADKELQENDSEREGAVTEQLISELFLVDQPPVSITA